MNKYSTDNENVKGKRMSDEKTVKLSDICILEKGQQIDTSLLDDTKPYRYINGGIKESGYYDDFNTSGESVLISEGGASCGYINYVNENFWCGCHCYRLHDIKVFPKYLFHALKANQQRIMALRTGSAMPNIQKSTIQKFELKIHDDINTQKKVSSMLDKCNELIEKHKLTLEKYDSLIKSRFIEMFGEPIENTKLWKEEPLGNCCLLKAGKAIKASELADKDKEHPYPCFGGNGIRGYIGKKSHTGKIVLIGRQGALCGNVQLTDGDFYATEHAVVTTPKTELNSTWLYHLLFLMDLNRYKSGAAQPGLTVEKLNTVPLMIVPLKLQNDFAAFVQQIDKSKFAVQKSLEKAETLYKSLMQEYFG